MADKDFLGALRALSNFLPGAQGIESEHIKEAFENMEGFEREAVEKFCRSGEKCMAKLTGDTIVRLGRVLSGTRAVARGRTDIIETDDGKAQSVYELLEKYDADQDGVLSREEFLNAARTLMGASMKDEELEKLAKSVDKNKDGSVDIHEFTVWLYEEMTDSGKVQSAPELPKAESKKPESGDVAELQKKIEKLQAELQTKVASLSKMEERHEEEVEASLDFWRGIAKNCILTIDEKVDLEKSEWLGNGKFGFVLKAARHKDKREVVVKMMGLRWAHLAVKEWQHGSTMGKHPNLVDYDDVMLHNDDDNSFQNLLQQGYESGKLQSRTKRTKFPDRYICLTQELMNRGTVQDWMDDDTLLPGGVLSILKNVAGALAFMHKKGVTHNDIKPENVMLHQEGDDVRSPVHVKLGDLGCAQKSTERAADYWQYGMTAFCMVTGEKFGTRKYRAEIAGEFCDEAEAELKRVPPCPLTDSLSKVPGIMRKVYPQEISMEEISNHEALQKWGFFDGELEDADADEQKGACRPHKLKDSKGHHEATARHACLNIHDDD